MQVTNQSPTKAQPGLPWYGLRVRSRCEAVVTASLQGKGYEPFFASYPVRRRRSDRIKQIDVPLFPGYVFCRIDITHRLPVLTTPGIVEIVGIGKVPAPIDDSEIEAVQKVLAVGLPPQAWPFVHTGDRVQVVHGPLRGVEGVVVSVQNRQHLVVSITLLQRSVSVALDPSWVRTVQAVGRQ